MDKTHVCVWENSFCRVEFNTEMLDSYQLSLFRAAVLRLKDCLKVLVDGMN
jgi:hypothetical protein